MKAYIKFTVIPFVLVPTLAGAVGLPTSHAPDFSKWAAKTLADAGITNARVIETHYPFDFTYCQQGSASLWRYDVMPSAQLEAVRQGKIAKPIDEASRRVEIEPNSNACQA